MENFVGPNQVRDEEYYFEDGNCVLTVGRVFFNLHRTILRRNSTFFNTLFSLPKVSGDTDGQSKDQPIVCHDPAAAFRAWCSALYAGFNDPTIETLDEEKIAHIGLMAHKYECDAMEKWAQKIFLVRLDEENLTNKCLEHWLQVATQCHWPKNIVTAVETDLLGSISKENPHRLRDVLRIADSVGSENLKARAYYRFLRCHKWSLSPPQRELRDNSDSAFALVEVANSTWSDPLTSLTDSQRLRLYHGFIGLSGLQDCLRVLPAVHVNCACISLLKPLWAKEVSKTSVDSSYLDPKEFLEKMRRSLDVQPRGCGRDPGSCALVVIRDLIDGILRTFEDNLVKFFPKNL